MAVGESTPERPFILEVLGEASQVVQEIPVSGYMRIGRGSEEFKPDVLIPPACTSASRQHATLDFRALRPVLEDQSSYGTIVNGDRVEDGTTELSDGDEIIFGLPGDGWRVRLRCVDPHGVTEPADPLELLTVSENPRQIRMGREVIEENLGRDAFRLLIFLTENKGSWYPTSRLEDLLWSDEPDGGPTAAHQALSRCKRRVNDILKPYLQGQDAIVAAPFKGYCMKPRLDAT